MEDQPLIDPFGREMSQEFRCQGKVWSTGEQCKKFAVTGTNVCLTHGAGAPQVRRGAHLRILEMAELAVDVHEKILRETEDERVALKAVEMVYERVGLRPNPQHMDVGTSRDLLMKKILQSKGEDVGVAPLASEDDEIVDAEIVEE